LRIRRGCRARQHDNVVPNYSRYPGLAIRHYTGDFDEGHPVGNISKSNDLA
jgi:hypothetical protein